MNERPVELTELLEDLKRKGVKSNAVSVDESRMVVHVYSTADRYEFTGPEAELLLASPETVEMLFEVLDYPEETNVELTNLVVDEVVLSVLRTNYATVN